MRFSTLFLLFFFCLNIFSQELALGNVTVEELQKTQSDIEPDAPAEYIFRKATYVVEMNVFGFFSLKVNIQSKLKIYSKEGYDWANFEIPVYTNGGKEHIFYENAVTYNLVDGKVEKTNFESKDQIIEKIGEDYEVLKVMMPNVKVGSIIEFSCSYPSQGYRSLPKWYFQYQIPIQNSELSVTIPEFHEYKIHSLSYYEIDKADSFKKNKAGYNEVVTKYNVKNLPSYKESNFASNIRNYLPSVEYFVTSVRSPTTGEVHFVELTWEDVIKRIYRSDYFDKELKTVDYFQTDLNHYIQSHADNSNVTEVVFNFVKQRMNWNDYVGIFSDKGLKHAYQQRTGNVAEINLMLVAMLKNKGIKAYPVLVSTRKNGISNFPAFDAFNYIVAAVKTDEGVYLYDATSKNAAVQIVPLRALNWKGRMIYESGFSDLIDMMPNQISKKIVNATINVYTNGMVAGKYRSQYTDYNAFLYREENGSLSIEDNIQRIEGLYNQLQIKEIAIQNLKDVNQPVIEEIAFSKSNASDIVADKIYFSPMLMFGLETSPFKSDRRDFPIDFLFPKEEKYMISITIPDGFEIESMPKSSVFEFQDNMLNFKFQLNKINNTIQVSQIFKINNPIIPSEYYQAVKDFFSKMVEKNKEQIVLKKM